MSRIQPEEARHVLWSIGDPRGYRPGSFTETLLSAIAKADVGNRQRLFQAFPGLVQAATLARTAGGREELARIAEARP
ncbi:hypothetical protein [Leucobacter luti]|uniref:hypothetical protein n=1 Tax=Leucobacter luti TaxID=340320 RepID=UPI003D03E389